VFFAGDLNYRTSDVAPTTEDMENYPRPGQPRGSIYDISDYLSKDQLNRERKGGRVFQGFEEVSPITFPPTYKYQTSKDMPIQAAGTEPASWPWATHRFPSWCDRILYLSSTKIQIHSYDILPLQRTSDHRPVALSVSIPMVSPSRTIDSPYSLNPNFAQSRVAARRLEVVVGVLAYLSVTREGNTVLAGILAGAIASWYIMQSIITV